MSKITYVIDFITQLSVQSDCVLHTPTGNSEQVAVNVPLRVETIRWLYRLLSAFEDGGDLLKHVGPRTDQTLEKERTNILKYQEEAHIKEHNELLTKQLNHQ